MCAEWVVSEKEPVMTLVNRLQRQISVATLLTEKSRNVLVRMKLLKQAPDLEVNLLVQECPYEFTNVLLIVYNFFKATALQTLRERTEFPFLKELTFGLELKEF